MRELSSTLPLLPNVWLGTSIESVDYLCRLDGLRHTRAAIRFISFEPLLGSVAGADLTGVDWVIVGGESGPRAPPMEPGWVEEIEELCREFGIAFFFKQWGGTRPKSGGRKLHDREWSEYPEARAACVTAAE
jgi:protein gp37